MTLARRVIADGVAVYTGAAVEEIAPGRLTVAGHAVRAHRHIVVATEGYSSAESGRRRNVLPLNSSMLVTEPLTADQWKAVGWDHADGISGTAHTYFYGQRTPDGRIAIGGRGKPYRFASRFDDGGSVDDSTVRALYRVVRQLFPQVDLKPAHAWCGVLGVARDWSPFIDSDTSAGITRIGGYAGQGLTAAHLAGRITADVVTRAATPLTRLPWVRPMPRKWEPEPLRWIGANALYSAYRLADSVEARSSSDRTSLIATVADRIAGR